MRSSVAYMSDIAIDLVWKTCRQGQVSSLFPSLLVTEPKDLGHDPDNPKPQVVIQLPRRGLAAVGAAAAPGVEVPGAAAEDVAGRVAAGQPGAAVCGRALVVVVPDILAPFP